MKTQGTITLLVLGLALALALPTALAQPPEHPGNPIARLNALEARLAALEASGAGISGISGYESTHNVIYLTQPGSGYASDGTLQYWTSGTVFCPTGKSIFGASHGLRRADGLRLSDQERATLNLLSTNIQNVNAQGFATLGPGTGAFTVTYLNPNNIALAADADYVCASVTP